MTQMQTQVREFRMGRVAGLELSIVPSAFWSMAALGLGLGVVGLWLLGMSAGEAILFGLVGIVIHWASEFWHQLGHTIAARSTGYPMTGLRFWGLFSTSLYPVDEPALPGRIHIRRALGGPIASILLGLLFVVVILLLGRQAGLAWWLALFAAVENLLMFGLGAFLPLGFTDGSTLLHWWGK